MKSRRGSKKPRGGFFVKTEKLELSFARRVGIILMLVGVLFGIASPGKNTISSQPQETNEAVLGTTMFEPVIEQGEIAAKEDEPVVTGLRVPIVFYHYVQVNPRPKEDPGRDKLLVTPANFDSQMKYLRDNGWTPITLDDLVEAFRNPGILPAKPIILTFDDGYTDFYFNALPILQKYNFKVTLYALSRGQAKDPGMYLSNAQLREIAASPLVTVASHTQTHAYLKGRSEGVQRQEIVNSKKELEAVTGKPVRHFAYPYGAFDEVSLRLIREAGYETAASTIISTVNDDSTRYALRRVRVGNYPASKYFIDQITR